MQIVDQQTWSYNLFQKGLDMIEISEPLSYANTAEACRIKSYFDGYPICARYFLKVSSSILGFSVVNKETGQERFALGRMLICGDALLRVYSYSGRQKLNQIPLRLENQTRGVYVIEGVPSERLASGLVINEYELGSNIMTGLNTLYVGEGVREIDIPLLFVGESEIWDAYEEQVGMFSIELGRKLS